MIRIVYAIAGIYFLLSSIKLTPSFLDVNQVLAFTGLTELVAPSLLIPSIFLFVITSLFALFLINTVWYFSSPVTYAVRGQHVVQAATNWLDKIIGAISRRVGSIILALLITAVVDVIFLATGIFECVTERIPGGSAEYCPPQGQVILLLIASMFIVWAVAPKSLYVKKH